MRVDARNRFLAACSLAGAATTAYRNPKPAEHTDGECWIDIARLGSPDAPSVLVLACSLNGDEGYCGSTIMTEWLSSGHQRDDPRDVGLIMLHAVLPTRWTARSAPPPDNTVQRSWSDAVLSAAAKRFASYTEHTRKRPENEERPIEPSATDTGWMEAASDAIVNEIIEHAQNVALLEFHTGFRPRGDIVVASCHPPASEASGRLKSWFGESTETEGQAILDIFSLGFGSRLTDLSLTAAHIEFGVYTIGGILGVGARSNTAERRADILSLFSPLSEEWHKHLSSEGTHHIEHTLTGLGKA